MRKNRKISIMIPCYNEEDNIQAIYEAVINEIKTKLHQYDYEILFIDNKSTDMSRKIIRKICSYDDKVKSIFNIKNFGQFNSPYYGLCNVTGDCAIMLCADFQDPIEMIPVFVKEWEKGAKVVCGIKTTSKENSIMFFLRSCYYKAIKKMSDVDQIEHFTGFGLYDRSFLEVLKKLDDPTPFLRGIVAEYAPDRIEVPYEQKKRRAGKTHNNLYSLYDAAMLSFTSYTKIGLRLATFMGFCCSFFSLVVALIYFVFKLMYWERFTAGTAPIVIGIFFLGSVQLFFIGLIGEYIMQLNVRAINRPLVIEEERINYNKNVRNLSEFEESINSIDS